MLIWLANKYFSSLAIKIDWNEEIILNFQQSFICAIPTFCVEVHQKS